jgi:hypothetical protein
MSHRSRQLWQSTSTSQGVTIGKSADNDSDNTVESFNTIFQRFSSRPAPQSLLTLCSNALVVGQEFSLACFLLARHRVALLEEQQLSSTGNLVLLQQQQERVDRSTLAILLALAIVLLYSARSNTTSNTNTTSHQDRKTKVKQRTTDAFLLAILLRFVASVLRSLTASYSSDTVQALAVAGMIVHVLACDYSYANGTEPVTVVVRRLQQRPIFQGGTISLNAALFSTTLLVSRLSSNLTCYVFVTLSIVVFSFYPATRHAVAAAYHPSKSRKCKVKVNCNIAVCSPCCVSD